MSQELGVTKPFVGWLQEALDHILEVLGGLPVSGEGDLGLVGVGHDVGVGVDDGPFMVLEGRTAEKHLEGENSQTPVVALRPVTVALKWTQDVRINSITLILLLIS